MIANIKQIFRNDTERGGGLAECNSVSLIMSSARWHTCLPLGGWRASASWLASYGLLEVIMCYPQGCLDASLITV